MDVTRGGPAPPALFALLQNLLFSENFSPHTVFRICLIKKCYSTKFSPSQLQTVHLQIFSLNLMIHIQCLYKSIF